MTKPKPKLSTRPKLPPQSAKHTTVAPQAAAAFMDDEKPRGRPKKASSKGRTWEKLSLYISPEASKALRHHAVEQKADLSDVVDDALRVFLKMPPRTETQLK